jgi:hypothetical protein
VVRCQEKSISRIPSQKTSSNKNRQNQNGRISQKIEIEIKKFFIYCIIVGGEGLTGVFALII